MLVGITNFVCNDCLPQFNFVSTWSRGMIPALGAGGPEFDSRSGPTAVTTPFSCNSTFTSFDFSKLFYCSLIFIVVKSYLPQFFF